MRLPYVLLVATSVLLATGNALPTEIEGGKRSLRSLKTVTNADAQDEERACSYCYTFSFGMFDKALPEQFERMRTQRDRLRTVFENWRTGYGTVEEAVKFMKGQGLSKKAITQFTAAYVGYLTHKTTKAAIKAAEEAAKNLG